ncbi:MAG: PDZ domain-containing protein, partial [Acetobacteraceae bacterium]|nr:PDZ domain-containing protein [Acetobacteraceae bacterium]
MSRLAVLILLLNLAATADAQPLSPTGFNEQLSAEVYVAALAFMAPRILDPVPVPQLAVWGLRGLTALDPDLSADVAGPDLVLSLRDRIIAARPLPPTAAPQAWGGLAASLAAAAWPYSPAVRRAGTQGIVQAFFDELFNHLDPYSRYIGPADAREDEARRIGTAGAGLVLANRGGAVTVIEAIPDGAGAAAGIGVGDRILAVNGRPVGSEAAGIVARRIAGPEGSPVTITWRTREGRLRTAAVERATTPPETVFAERSGNLLLIRISSFSRRTDERLTGEITRALAGSRPVQGLVLDLRDNRGGLLRQAVTIADKFLPPGTVVTTAGRDPDASRVWRSSGSAIVGIIPLVVIVDGRTASAAEILAAALADRGRAVIVGSTTMGKGLVQTVSPLPDGGELFVTWSRVLAPRGWPLQGLGVLPQVCTSRGQDKRERELADLGAG